MIHLTFTLLKKILGTLILTEFNTILLVTVTQYVIQVLYFSSPHVSWSFLKRLEVMNETWSLQYVVQYFNGYLCAHLDLQCNAVIWLAFGIKWKAYN